MIRRKWLIVVILMIFFLGSAYASGDKIFSSTPPIRPDSWHFLIAPYAWTSWLKANVTLGNKKTDLNITPRDLLPALQAVAELHMEANKGNWTFMIDPTYFKLSKSTDVDSIGSASLTSKAVVMDFGEYYRFASFPMQSNPNNVFNIEGFAGGRYWYLDNNLDLQLPIPTPDIDLTKKWLDPVIGGRLNYRIGDSWRFTLSGDIGGFHLVSDFTWEAKAVAIWQFSRYVGIGAGYRAIGVDYEDGNTKLTKFKLDTVIYGPVLGITFVF